MPSEPGVDCPKCGTANSEFCPRCRFCGERLPEDSGRLPSQPKPSPQEAPGLPEPEPQQAIGPYVLLELLGQGGMGQVWRARHTGSGQLAALKSLRVPSEALLRGLRREIHALARLRHPGIVRILDAAVQETTPWYAMELLEGLTLHQWQQHRSAAEPTRELFGPTEPWWTVTLEKPMVSRTRKIHPAPAWSSQGSCGSVPSASGARSGSVPEVLTLTHRLCSALGYLHGEGIVHGDLKPQNVIVREDGRPVLVDFGLAGQFSSELSREALQVDSSIAGTVAYMAPEQIRGELVDARADLYALGCILYELLTGRPPFLGKSPEVLIQHLDASPLPPSLLVGGLSAQLDALVLRLLEKEPRRRYGYAGDVAAALVELGAEDWQSQEVPQVKTYLYRPGFSGRGEDLYRVRERLTYLAQQSRGAVLLLGGESGVGKTRFLMELGRGAVQRRLQVLGGMCQDHAGRPLEALRRPLQAVADRCSARGEAETERLLGRRGPVLALYEPVLSQLPGQALHPKPVDLPADAARLRLFDCLAETLGAYAEEVPLVLLLDDLQWADELTVGFLEHLGRTRKAERSPLQVVGTYRTEEIGDALRHLLRSEGVEGLVLGRLEEPAVVTMVGDMLALEPAPPRFSHFLAQHSEGNPFFVAEYLRTAVAEGLLWRDAQGFWQVAGPEQGPDSAGDFEALTLPRSLRDLVGRRLDSLSPEGRRLAQFASVLGRELEERLLVAVTPMEPPQLLEAIRELLTRQVLEEGGAGLLRFAHDKLREVAREGLSAEARRALHHAAALAIESSSAGRNQDHLPSLGHHWEEAGVLDKARECYLNGARHAQSRWASAEAERLYRAYLKLVSEPTRESVATRNDLGRDVLRLRGRNEEALAEHEKARAEARSIGAREIESESLRLMGLTHWHSGRTEPALQLFEQALGIEREIGHRRGEATVLNNLGMVRFGQGRMEEAREHYEQVLALHRETGNRKSEANLLGNLAALYRSLGRMEMEHQILEQALALHREMGDRLSEGRVLGNLASNAYESLGQAEKARQLHEEALAIAREVGNRAGEGFVLGNLAFLVHNQGQFQEAQQLYEQTLAVYQEVGNRRSQGIVLNNLANLYRDSGQTENARELYEQALALVRDVGNRRVESYVLGDRATLCKASGQVEEAQRLYEQGLALAREVKDSNSEGILLGKLADLLRLTTADLDRADALAKDGENLLSESKDVLELGKLLCIRGHLELARGHGARKLLEESVRLTGEIGRVRVSELGQALAKLQRAQESHEAGWPLFRGERIEDLPEGLRRWLSQTRQLPSALGRT